MILIGRGCSSLSSVLLIFLVAHWLGAAEVGVYTLAVKYTSILLGFSSLGLEGLLIRDVTKDPNKLIGYLKASTVFRFSSSLVFLLLMMLFVKYISGYESRIASLIVLYGINLIPESLYRLYQSALIVLNKYFPIALVGVLRLLVGIPVVFFLLSAGKSVTTVMLGISIVNLVSLLLLVLYLWQSIRANKQMYSVAPDRELPLSFKKLTRETASFAAIDLLFALDWQIDIILLSFFCDKTTVGVYSIAQSILSFLMLILYAADMVIYAFITRSLVRGWQFIASAYRRLTVVILIGVLFVSIFSVYCTEIWKGRFSNREFTAAIVPLRWLVISWGVHFANVPAARLIMSTGNTRYVAFFLAMSVVMNIMFSIALVGHLGLVAPAISRFISALIYASLCALFALRLLRNVTNNTKGVLSLRVQ